MAEDLFRGLPGHESPASRLFVVTPNDNADLTYVTRGVYVGGTGNLQVVSLRGDTVTFTSVQAGTLLPIRVSRILATGTTATNIVGVT